MAIPGLPASAMPDQPASRPPPPPPAPGDPPFIQRMIDGALIVYPLAYYGWSGDDALNINAALLQAAQLERGGTAAPVRLAPYPYTPLSPVTMFTGSVLEGVVPVNADAGGQVADLFGAVLAPAAGWAAPGLAGANPGVIYLAPPAGSSGVLRRPVIRHLWVDLRAAPLVANGGPLGISSYGSVSHGLIEHVGVWGNSADPLSDNISFAQNPNAQPNPTSPDGWEVVGVISQSYGRNGLYGFMRDSAFDRCHFQGAPATTTDNACAQLDKANNVRFVNSRFDQSVYGLVTDSNPGGVPNVPGSSLTLAGCGFENAYHNAVYLKNTSSTGQQTRTPVLMDGCSLDFAGRDGTSAAIRVDGWNLLTAWNCNITNNGGTFPQAGAEFHSTGTGPGVPALVVIDGGIWNPAAGGAYFINPATPTILRYRFYGVIGAMQGGGAPVNPSLQVSTTWP